MIAIPYIQYFQNEDKHILLKNSYFGTVLGTSGISNNAYRNYMYLLN